MTDRREPLPTRVNGLPALPPSYGRTLTAGLAALEIPVEEIPRLWQDGRHEAIVTRFRELGYLYVAVDLAGFQSGSANLLLGLRRRSNG